MLVILGLNIWATMAMAGLILFVQIVHYPILNGIKPNFFRKYQQQHMQKTSYIIGPLMVIELVTTVWLLFFKTPLLPWFITGVVLEAIIWASTLLIQGPLHLQLSRAHSPKAMKRLLRSNWIRVAAWWLRALVLFIVVTLLPYA